MADSKVGTPRVLHQAQIQALIETAIQSERTKQGTASSSDIAAAVAALVNSAPSTLDTLGELATALQSGDSAAATLLASVATKTTPAAASAAAAALIATQHTVDNSTYAPHWEASGPVGIKGLTPVMASGVPAITLGALNDWTSPGIATPVRYVDLANAPAAITVLGTEAVKGSPLFTQGWTAAAITPVDATNSFQWWCIEFWSDAPQLEVFTFAGGQVRVLMDGQKTAAAPTTIPGGGNYYGLRINATTRKMRLWRIEFDSMICFQSVAVGPTDTIYPSQVSGPHAIVVGDSFTEGGQGGIFRADGFVPVLGQLMGWGDTWASGSGGTGYLTGGPAGKTTYRARLTHDVTQYDPDVIVFTGGRNDGSAGLQAEAALTFAQTRAACPDALIVVCSPFNKNTAEIAYFVPFRDALQAAAATVSNTVFIDLQGYVTDANAPVLVSGDGVHPTQVGYDAWARLIATLLTQKLAARY